MKLDILYSKYEESNSKNNNENPVACVPIPKVQTDIVLLLRVIDLMRCADAISRSVQYCNSLSNIIEKSPPLSLSAYWCNIFEKIQSNVKSETDSNKPLLNFPELSYLHPESFKEKSISDRLHDPIGIVQIIRDFLEDVIQHAPAHEKHIPLKTLLLLGIKSGRLSILLRALLLSLKFKIKLESNVVAYLYDAQSLITSNSLILQPVNMLSSKPNELPQLKISHFHRLLFSKDMISTLSVINHIDEISSAELHRKTSSKSKGLILSFGKADHGKLGHGDSQINRTLPTIIETLQDLRFSELASMSTYSLAVSADGVPFVWGTGGSTTASHAPRTDIYPQILDSLPSAIKIVDVSCGLAHALFLAGNGRVFSWGNGGNGRLGLGDISDRSEASLVEGLAHCLIDRVRAGASHSLARSSTGALWSWGKNTQGQCGCGNNEDVLRPVLVSLSGETVVDMAAGWEHTIALTMRGTVHAWGSGYKDSRRGIIPPVLGLGSNESKSSPEKITTLEGIFISAIACGWDHCLALSDEGKVFSWGSGQNGKLGHNNENNYGIPTLIESVRDIRVTSVDAGCEHSALVDSIGRVFTFGHGDGGRLGHGDSSQCMLPTIVTTLIGMRLKVLKVHCGDKFTMLLADEDEIVSSLHEGDDRYKDDYADYTVDHKDSSLPTISFASLAEAVLSIGASGKVTGNPSQWPFCIECSVETLGSLLLLLENQAETLASNIDDGSMSPAIIHETLKSFENAATESELWKFLGCILRVIELNIRSFVGLHDELLANGFDVEKNVSANAEAGYPKLSDSPKAVIESRYDSGDDLDDLEEYPREGLEDNAANASESPVEKVRYTTESMVSNSDICHDERELYNDDTDGRISPALSASNASYEDADTFGEIDEDSQEMDESEMDVQSAILSSYDMDNVSVNVGSINEKSEILPRYFDALCSIASSTYQLVTGIKFCSDVDMALRIWIQLQRIIGGSCSRAIFLPGELRRVLYECIISPADFVHIAPALALAMDATPSLEEEVLSGAEEDLGSNPVTFLQLRFFAESIVPSFLASLSSSRANADNYSARPSEVSVSLTQMMSRFLLALLQQSKSSIPFEYIGSACTIFELMGDAVVAELKFLQITKREKSQPIILPIIYSFVITVLSMEFTFTIIMLFFPFTSRVANTWISISENDVSESTLNNKDLKAFLTLFMNKILLLNATCSYNLLSLVMSGKLGGEFYNLNAPSIIAVEVLRNSSIDFSPKYDKVVEIEFTRRVVPEYLKQDEKKSELNSTSCHTIEVYDKALYSTVLITRLRENTFFWQEIGITTYSADMNLEPITYFEESIHKLRLSLFEMYIKLNCLTRNLFQTTENNNIISSSAPGTDYELFSSWLSSLILSIAFTHLQNQGSVCSLHDMLSRCSLLMNTCKSLHYMTIAEIRNDDENTIKEAVKRFFLSNPYLTAVQLLNSSLLNYISLGAYLNPDKAEYNLKERDIIPFNLILFIGSDSINIDLVFSVLFWQQLARSLVEYCIGSLQEKITMLLNSDMLTGYLEPFEKISHCRNNSPIFSPNLEISDSLGAIFDEVILNLVSKCTASSKAKLLTCSIHLYSAVVQKVKPSTVNILLGHLVQAVKLSGVFNRASEILLNLNNKSIDQPLYPSIVELSAECIQSFNQKMNSNILVNESQKEFFVSSCQSYIQGCFDLFHLLHSFVKAFSFSKAHIVSAGVRKIERCCPAVYHGLSTNTGSFFSGFMGVYS